MYNFEAMGNKIRTARTNKHLSREDLAELCSISDRSISNIERGLSEPKLVTIVKICSVLEINMNELKQFYQEGQL